MTAAGVAVFDTLTAPGFLDSINARAAQLSQGLLALSSKWGMKGERGEGLLRALIPDRDDGPAIVALARHGSSEGMSLNAPSPNTLRFMPVLNSTADDIDPMVARVVVGGCMVRG